MNGLDKQLLDMLQDMYFCNILHFINKCLVKKKVQEHFYTFFSALKMHLFVVYLPEIQNNVFKTIN